MSGWLQSAAKVFGRGGPEPPPEPIPYNVACRCGHHVEGERLPRFQTVPCPRCGQLLFILPNDAYPHPKPKKLKSSAPARPPVALLELDDDAPRRTTPAAHPPNANEPLPPTEAEVASWADEDSPRPPRRPRPEFPVTDKPGAKAVPEKATAKPAAPVPWGPPAETFDKRMARWRGGMADGLRALRRQLTPVRILALTILIAVAITGWSVQRAKAREQAEILLRTHAEAVNELIAENDLVGLEAELQEQTAAAELLGRNDDQSARLSALFRETMVVNRLAPGSLFALISEADKAAGGSDIEWERQFESSYRGKWVILDSPLTRGADVNGVDHLTLDVPLSIRGKPLRVEADLKAFEQIEAGLTSFLFAAQLDSLRPPTLDDPSFVLVLAPESGFLWHRPETLAFIGWQEADPEAQAALATRLDGQRSQGTSPTRHALLSITKNGLPKRRPHLPEEASAKSAER
jgi:hypothetical protein